MKQLLILYLLQSILRTCSKIHPQVTLEKQKDLIHTIINKITVNEGNSQTERSVKDIELYFDASKNNNYVLTCDTAPPAQSETPDKSAPPTPISSTDAETSFSKMTVSHSHAA